MLEHWLQKNIQRALHNHQTLVLTQVLGCHVFFLFSETQPALTTTHFHTLQYTSWI